MRSPRRPLGGDLERIDARVVDARAAVAERARGWRRRRIRARHGGFHYPAAAGPEGPARRIDRMSSTVLARKYRPRNFETLVGQAHVVQALVNALTQQRLHHAYLFTGTRGVGKTTVARILAKSLNCTGPDGSGGITAQPCGVCAACRDIDAGRFIDYVELDAASNRGVEEITRLLDQAVYKPVVGRFKVYLIDEVHMLSNARLQRDAEDARGAARVPEVRPRDDRPAEGAGDGAVALPAVQPAADGGGDDRRAPRLDPRAENVAAEAECAEADRPRGARLDARRAVAHRPGDRLRQRPHRGSRRAPDARRGRPQPRRPLHRGGSGARRRGADRRRRRPARAWASRRAGALEEMAALLQEMAVAQAVPGCDRRGRPRQRGRRPPRCAACRPTRRSCSTASSCPAEPSSRSRPTNTAAW